MAIIIQKHFYTSHFSQKQIHLSPAIPNAHFLILCDSYLSIFGYQKVFCILWITMAHSCFSRNFSCHPATFAEIRSDPHPALPLSRTPSPPRSSLCSQLIKTNDKTRIREKSNSMVD
ncbi:Protein CBG27865 [Caenorhabditis briggsae]|uniref:Protein CBG27865 n=1 Tax=Caenorhabditis briggsae TaxID=6238 RepID=B6IEG0_CAEBR|nr:Protein CBG27865 [Caenorhabditis briggsae]CAR98290.1 Protein CBG27865 [Caenorhabditis briggsae]